MKRALFLLVTGSLATLTLATATAHAQAEAVPLDKQKGVRGRVVVAPDLFTTPVPLSEAREKELRTPALVRRPLGREVKAIVEPAPSLVVMLEGEGIRQENPEIPKLRVEGMRFIPGGIVAPRAMAVQIENREAVAINIVDETGARVATIPPGATADANLRTGEHLLHVAEQPFATAAVRVLDRGRVLPVANGEIPLVDIPGGEYTLTFFFGAEPLRIQPLVVPEQGLVFIDATVSAHRVVEVSIKDASMRVAVPPSGVPKDGPPDGTP
jgi:hypothetical protein